jgi:hypothetical protein
MQRYSVVGNVWLAADVTYDEEVFERGVHQMSVDTGQTAPEAVEAPPTAVVLTDTAAEKVKALLDQEGRDDLALRIAVQPGGCSGLRYQLFFDERE